MGVWEAPASSTTRRMYRRRVRAPRELGHDGGDYVNYAASAWLIGDARTLCRC
ncbi:hypothetical protein [Microbacterium paulum]